MGVLCVCDVWCVCVCVFAVHSVIVHTGSVADGNIFYIGRPYTGGHIASEGPPTIWH